MKKVVFISLILLLLVVSPLVVWSISSDGVTNPVGLVPAKADMVGEADIGRILQDKDLTGIYDKIAKNASYPQTFGDALNGVKDQYNIDLRSFQEGVFFSDISRSDTEGNYSGVIVTGTFNKDDLIAAIRSLSGMEWGAANYKEYEIYSNDIKDAAFAFLASNELVMGTIQSVKDVIDVKKGDAEALNGEVLDTYNKLGNALIKVAAAVPAGALEKNLGQSASRIMGNLSAFEQVKTAGVTVAKNAQSLTINVKLCCADSASAQNAEDSINDLISFIRLIMNVFGNQGQKQTVENLLNKVDVSRSDSCVDITLSATITETEDLIQSSNHTS